MIKYSINLHSNMGEFIRTSRLKAGRAIHLHLHSNMGEFIRQEILLVKRTNY